MKILCLESSGPVCSAALFQEEEMLGLKETREPYAHSSFLAQYAQELIQEHGRVSAIAVSAGPGSYTGLRIGVSLAKGLCSGLGIPLIAIPTLEAMAFGFIQLHGKRTNYVPCIDARRMEVYTQSFNDALEEVSPIQALVVDDDSEFGLHRDQQKALFGDGADKLTDLLGQRADIEIIPGFLPSAQFMGSLAMTKFAQQQFEDVAYYEPRYLKEFIALKSKKR